MAKVLLDNNLSGPVLRADIPGGYVAGDDNPLWNRLVHLAIKEVFGREKYNGTNWTSVDFDGRALTVQVVKQLVAVGQEVLDYQAYAKVPDANLTDTVPPELKGAYVLDGNGNPTAQLKTWAQWGGTYPSSGGNNYIELNRGGSPETGTNIRIVDNLANIEVLSHEDTLAELSA